MKRYRLNCRTLIKNLSVAAMAAGVIGMYGWMILNLPYYMTTL